MNANTNSTEQRPLTIQVAYNPLTKKYQRVELTDELGTSKIYTMYLSGDKYVFIPENDED
jgi:hypothetical protein